MRNNPREVPNRDEVEIEESPERPRREDLETAIKFWLSENDGALRKFAETHKGITWKNYESLSKITRWHKTLTDEALESDLETLTRWGNEMDIETLIAEALSDEGFVEKLKEKDPSLLREATADVKIESDSMGRVRKEVLARLEKIYKDYKVGKVLREGVETVAVHGGILYESTSTDESGERVLLPTPATDLDAKMTVHLLGLGNVSINRVEFVEKGTIKPKALNVDTGGINGVDVRSDGTIIFDHHGSEYIIATSASEQVYRNLAKEGLIERVEWIESLIRFINEVDNLSYETDRKTFIKDWSKTLYGLYDRMRFEDIIEFFTQGLNPHEPLPPEFMNRATTGAQRSLHRLSNVRQKLIDYIDTMGIRRAGEKMRLLGAAYETPELSSVLLNTVNVVEVEDGSTRIESELPIGNGNISAIAARAMGEDTYVVWYDEQKSFFASSTLDLGKSGFFAMIKKSFPNAKLIRGHMIVSGKGEADTISRFLKIAGMKV